MKVSGRVESISNSKITAIDVFCGAGGLSLGFEQAGIKVVLGIDSDPKCISTYSQNLDNGVVKDVTEIRDVRNFVSKYADIDKIDLVIGGPPCQTFSPVGRIKLRSLGRDPERDQRTELWKYFLKFVEELSPEFFVMENVPGMTRVPYNGYNLVDHIVKVARNMGYNAEWRILDASDFGVPQKRKRLFIIGRKGNRPIFWPEKKVKKPVTVWEAISDLPKVPHGFREHEIEYDFTGRLTPYQELMRKGAEDVVYNHVTRKHNEDDLRAFSLLPEGGKYTDLPDELKRYRDDIFKDRYRKLIRNQPSWTIDAHISKDSYRYIYPSKRNGPGPHRTISVREAARLQSFPDTFVFHPSLTHAFRQIGNSVPPLLAKAVASAIIESMTGERKWS